MSTEIDRDRTDEEIVQIFAVLGMDSLSGENFPTQVVHRAYALRVIAKMGAEQRRRVMNKIMALRDEMEKETIRLAISHATEKP